LDQKHRTVSPRRQSSAFACDRIRRRSVGGVLQKPDGLCPPSTPESSGPRGTGWTSGASDCNRTVRLPKRRPNRSRRAVRFDQPPTRVTATELSSRLQRRSFWEISNRVRDHWRRRQRTGFGARLSAAGGSVAPWPSQSSLNGRHRSLFQRVAKPGRVWPSTTHRSGFDGHAGGLLKATRGSPNTPSILGQSASGGNVLLEVLAHHGWRVLEAVDHIGDKRSDLRRSTALGSA